DRGTREGVVAGDGEGADTGLEEEVVGDTLADGAGDRGRGERVVGLERRAGSSANQRDRSREREAEIATVIAPTSQGRRDGRQVNTVIEGARRPVRPDGRGRRNVQAAGAKRGVVADVQDAGAVNERESTGRGVGRTGQRGAGDIDASDGGLR